MSLIRLHHPVPITASDSPRRFERVHMFPGRHLGEEEFDREQAYADQRLASLLRGRRSGVVQGLELNLGPQGSNSSEFSISAGLALDGQGRALGLYYPLRANWPDLISEHLQRSGETDPTGVFYLLLQRSSRRIDDPSVDPCQRSELDPTRDTRRVVSATLLLQRLNFTPGSVLTTARERIENWCAADRVDGSFLSTLKSAVPLALLAIAPDGGGGHAPLWLSPEAGRYEALPASGYRVLLNQTSAALRRVMQQAAQEVTDGSLLAQYLRDNLQLDFLPAAGQLPLEWLQNPASTTPGLLWFPAHLGVDMVPVPEEAVLELINRHIARRVIDLRQPAGDRIRLLLAVNEPDYRPDLLDIPQTDARLESDLYRFYMRAYEAWRKWHQQFDLLYFVEPSDAQPLPNPAEAAVEQAVLDPAQFKHLDLPKPEPAPLPPLDLFNAIISRADTELDPDNPGVPYPFNKGIPTQPSFYTQWLVAGAPPPVPTPSEDGLVVQYAVALVELEAIENQIRATRTRVEKTRDLLLLMRQQLDSQTVALAALAGGVAGDGGGLQVARWLPYADLDARAEPSESTATPGVVSQTTSPSAAISAAPVAAFSSGMMTALSGSSSNIAKSISSSGLSSTLLKSSLNTTSTVARSNLLLTSKPQTFSAFELGINKSRLDLLARVTKQAVSTPAFEAKEYRFGVIDHISPEVNEYAKAYFGMKELLATLKDLFDANDARSLRSDLQRVGQTEEVAQTPGNADPLQRSNRLEAPSVLDNLASQQAGDDAKKRSLLLTQYRYHALFKAGRILTQWIAICEARYNNLERKLQAKLREQANKIAQIDKLAGLIRVARETLENRDSFRVEQLGDYGVAQRLLDEDWRRVFALNQERTRILSSALRGLYYVRVRGTPVTAALADPLLLRHGSSSDIVPGCDWTAEVALPETLTPFFDTVSEIPMADWSRLKPLLPKLPQFEQFDYFDRMRQARFKARPLALPSGGAGETLQARLQTVHLQNRSLMQQWSSLTLPAFSQSSLQTQIQAATVLSLEDLALASGALRSEAQALRDQLERAASCMLEKLYLLPGSVRLQWGQLAEDDRLRVEQVSWWPGLERAEADDFNATRTLSELIDWWFRQLQAEASANSRSALRNLVRALLIQASLGDPNEIVRGNVHVPPRQARIGERLQVKLNRAPAPGTRLQLLDPQQRVVAVLAIEDHTPQSTRVNIVDLVEPNLVINTRFSVVSNRLTREKL
ncbi:MAG: hypothetical protein KDI83_08055 [Gammaproteobacteria bacterium]|nr:hypothetical protein [Gammaproteobacteria bacterium]